jgi:ABC-type Na+ efflux pump permease subunit
MSKVWLIASDEFKRNVFKKSFILVLLSVPLLLAFNIGLGLLVSHLEKNDAPL